SALRTRMQDLGAGFGAKHGWERPEHFEPGRHWRRAGADQRKFGWAKPPWFDLVAEEHRAFRERVGIIDLSSFGKICVSGPGALALIERVCDSRVDRPVGRIIYSQFLNPSGRIVADLTVTRLAEDEFRIITGAGAIDSDLGWLRLNLDRRDGPVDIRDVTDEHAVIGIWGPRAREVLSQVTHDDVCDGALPFSTARPISIGGASVLA